MPVQLPPAIPQIPVSDLAPALSFYQSRLGFTLDWQYEDSLAGISRDAVRIFLSRVAEGPVHPVRIWLNLDSVPDVDALHRAWQQSGVAILLGPQHQPWGLYEFIAADGDGNSFRVFHDTVTPQKEAEAARLAGR